jgi:hypothetical protein
MRRLRRRTRIVFALLLLISLFSLTMTFEITTGLFHQNSEHKLYEFYINGFFKLLRFTLDTYMIIKFYGLFGFFVEKKRQRLLQFNLGFSIFNRLIIVWGKTLTILMALQSFQINALSAIKYSELMDNDTILKFYNIERFIIVPLIDFFTAQTILYLVYFLGARKQRLIQGLKDKDSLE